jgi:peroxiredoxin
MIMTNNSSKRCFFDRMRRAVLGTFFLSLTAAAVPQAVFSVRDANGKAYASSELSQHKATVFFFLATDCPNSNSYAPEMGRLFQEYKSRGVAFYSVYSDPSETADGVRKHDHEYALPFPSLLDPQQVLARDTGARGTPEAVVLSSSGKDLYRGRIDDRFANFGKTRLHVDQHDLRVALDQVLAGKPISNPYMPSLGCAIPGVN